MPDRDYPLPCLPLVMAAQFVYNPSLHSDLFPFLFVIKGVSGSQEGGNSPAGKEVLVENKREFLLGYVLFATLLPEVFLSTFSLCIHFQKPFACNSNFIFAFFPRETP